MADIFRHIYAQYVPARLPPKGSFAGQTVLVTGGTTGLGLAAAVHFLNLGAEEVIITARKAASPRAESAQKKILSQKDEDANGDLTVMDLEMNSYTSCVALVEALKKRFDEKGADKGRLAAALLNAGVSNGRYILSPTGMEETVQIDTLSTICLALLLLRWMKEKCSAYSAPPHIVLVSSIGAFRIGINTWPSYVKKDGSLLAHFAKEENWPGVVSHMQVMYGYAKLMLEYAKQELCKMALDGKGKPAVIITSVCPGPVETEIARNVEHGMMLRILISMGFKGFAKSPDYGARVYIRGALAKAEDHGKFLTDFLSDEAYKARAAPLITSQDAQEMQRQAWKEISETLRAEVPAAQQAFKQLGVS